ncbi:MAG: hypothetical protein MI976_15200 [Pseudomonadales bacterium]|nr:hypothetical protein [Pseudomonadales bacterium]
MINSMSKGFISKGFMSKRLSHNRGSYGRSVFWFITLPLCIALLSGSTNALSTEINQAMEQASKSLAELIPYAYDDQQFRAKSNQIRINQLLDDLNRVFHKKANLLGQKSDTAWITLKVLQEHLEETADLYQARYFAMSQYLLTSTPALCSTCHMQDSAHTAIESALGRESFANEYSFAEYLFTIRNYTEAKIYYVRHLNHDEVKTSRLQFTKPLERLLTIELAIVQSIPNTKRLLQEQLESVNHVEIKKIISDWIQGVDDIKVAGAKGHARLQTLFNLWFGNSPNMSHEFIMDENRRPQAIWLRAKLFEYLNHSKNDAETADTLYMLAILDRILGQDAPYSFANLYLKQCVMLYPSTSAAEKCLQEYKNHLSFYYGGSAGEAVPEELLEEYFEMKNALERN